MKNRKCFYETTLANDRNISFQISFQISLKPRTARWSQLTCDLFQGLKKDSKGSPVHLYEQECWQEVVEAHGWHMETSLLQGLEGCLSNNHLLVGWSNHLLVMVDGKMGSWYVLLWCGENPKLVNRLRTWGEARVLLRQRHVWQTPRIADLVGVQQWCMMMIGYAMNHEDDC
jgi:hypothetical protein